MRKERVTNPKQTIVYIYAKLSAIDLIEHEDFINVKNENE